MTEIQMKTIEDLEITALDMEEGNVEKIKTLVQGVMRVTFTENDICSQIKNALDKEFSLGWNVVVGRDFGSHVIHKTKNYMYLKVMELSILIWKS